MPMNVAMTLSLVDTASPQVRSFIGLLEQLQSVAANVTTRLQSSVSSIVAIGAAAQEALGQVAAIGAAAQASAAQVTAFGTAGAAAAGQMSAIGTASRSAASGMVEAGAAAQAAGGQIGGIGTQAQTAVGHTNTLANTLKGMAQIWAAFKIEGGLKEAAKDAIEFQNTTARLQAMNLGPVGTQSMLDAASRASKEVPQFSRNEMLEMAIDLRNAMGTAQHAIEMLPDFAQAAFNMKMGTPKGQVFDDRQMLLIAKSMELMGVTLDPERMRQTLDAITKIYVGTQGRVDARQILGNLQYMGPLARTMDISFLPTLGAMIEQVRSSSGGQGGVVGTQLTTLMNAVFGRGDASSIAERTRLGLVDPSKIVWTNQGNVNLQKSDKSAAGLAEFLSNPNTWAQSYLRPALERAGIDVGKAMAGDQTELAKGIAELNRLFKDRNAVRPAATLLFGQSLLEKDAANINQVLNNKQLYELNIKTAQAQIDAFMAQLKNLGIIVGNVALPALTALTKGFTALTESAASVFEKSPIIAQVAVITGVLGTLGLGLVGVINIMGKVGVATGGLGEVLVAAGAFMLRFAGIFGAMILAMTLADLVLDWEVNGKRVSQWLAGWMDGLVTSVKNGWLRMKEFFGLISRDAMQAAIDANNAAGTPIPANKLKSGGGREVGGSIRSAPFSAADAAAFKAAQTGTQYPVGNLFDQVDRPGPRPRGGGGGVFNEEAAYAHKDYRVAEEERRQSLKTLDLLYKSGLMSVNDYYDAVIQKSRDAAAQEKQAKQDEIDAIYKQKKITPADDRKLVSLRTDIELIALKEKGAIEDANINRGKAMEVLERKAVDIQREMMAVTGRRHEAELLHKQEQIEADTRLAVLNGRMTQSDADAYKTQAIAALKYNQDAEQVTRIKEQQQLKDEQLNNLVKAGQLTEEDAARQHHSNAVQAATDIQGIVELLQKWADASGDPKLQFAVAQLRLQTKGVLTELGPDAKAAAGVMGNAFTGLFGSLLTGTKGIKAAFHDFFASLAKGFADLAAKELSNNVIKALFGGKGGSEGGGGGFNLGSLFGGGGFNFGSLFSGFGGGGGFTPATSTGFSDVAFDLFSMPSFASGIDSVPRDMVARIHQGERIVPKHMNNQSGMGGGLTQINHFNAPVDTRSRAQVASATLKAIEMARRVR